MIIDNIKYASYYERLHPEFASVFEVLASLTAESEDKRYEVDGDKAFVNLSSYVNKPVSECKFENHKKYIDIQYVVSGEEKIDLTDSAVLTVTEDRIDDGDIAFYEDTEHFDTADLEPGDFVIIFPGEAHRPCVAPDGKGVQVKKAVAKIIF